MPYQIKNTGKWRAHRMINGVRKTKTFKTQRDAKRWEASQDEAEWNAEPTPTISCLEFITLYLDWSKSQFCQRTYHGKRDSLRFLLRNLPSRIDSFDQITPAIAFSIFNKRATLQGGNIANKDRKECGAAWEWGRRNAGLPTENPFRLVSKFKPSFKERYVPPETDFWKVVGSTTRTEDRAYLLIMLYTAARRDELFRLQWSDVDLVNKRLRLGTRKRVGGAIEYDYVPLVQRAVEALSSLPKKHMLVFCHADGRKYSYRQWFMRRTCARAGVKPFGFHAIRHLSASILAHEGVPLPVVQGVLRHKNATTTSRYLRSLGLDLPALEKAFFAHNVQNEGRQDDKKVININSLKEQ